MHVARRWLIPAFLTASLLALTVGSAEAQFAITPDGTSSGTVNTNTSGNTATFDVYPYAFNQYCWGTNGISCSVDSNGSGTVYVTFSTSSSTGSATVGLAGYSYDPPECDPQWMQCDLLWESGYRTYTIVAPNQPPQANWSVNPTTPNQNQTASFNNTSTDDTGIVSHAWTFGDGGTSSTASPSHTYTSGGQKTVRLIVTDGQGAADTLQQNITVNYAPTPSFNWNPNQPNEGANAAFDASASSDVSPGTISSYAWAFGDGQSGSGVSPSHAYAQSGQYQVRLIVTDNAGAADTLQQNITVLDLSAVNVTVADANPGLELNRSECVNILVGVASVVCDDFTYSYGFTPLTVVNRSRQLALTYNRSTAEHSGIIGVNVNIPAGQTPDEICVKVVIASVSPENCYDDALFDQGVWTRFAVSADYGDPSAVAKLLDYAVTVTSQTGPAENDTTITGRYVAIHGQQVFARGWWLGSYERIVWASGTYGSHLVWIGGDQSYRVYKETATDIFVAQTRSRPDTIVKVSGTEYQRRLIGGGKVHFNGSGIHQKTVDRLGYETLFTHDPQNRPTQVRFTTPSAGTITGYELSYNSTTGRLEEVRVRNAAGTGWDTFSVYTSPSGSSYVITAIAAPDGKQTQFAHTSGVMTEITEPGGRHTAVAYDDRKVSQVTVSHASSADSIVYAFDPASAAGTSTSSGNPDSPIRADSVGARLNGPRTDVADTTRFFTTGWGAARGIRNALGHTTWIERTNQTYPALPTRVKYPNDWVVKATYHANGLLSQAIDSATAQPVVTTYVWNNTWSQPSQITSPRGVVTEFSYDGTTGNRVWQRVANDTVRYTYNAQKLLHTVRDPDSNRDTLTYDAVGNLNRVIHPSSTGMRTTYQRDARGYVTVASRPTGLLGGTPDSVRVTTYYDVMGRDTLTQQTSTDTTTWIRTRTSYHSSTGYKAQTVAWGGLTASDSTSTGTTQWGYDGLGRLKAEWKPSSLDSLFYDEAGNVTTRRLKLTAETEYDITMSYDALNRLTQRVIPNATDTVMSINGVQFPYYTSPVLGTSGSNSTIYGDTETFGYNEMGDLIQADNSFARIDRTYTKNGRLELDSLQLRNYNNTSFGTHSYGVRYYYNTDGQDSVIVHPSWLSGGTDKTTYLYSTTTGRLTSITDANGEAYSFTYNGRGQPTTINLPLGSRTMTYDAVGRVASLGGTMTLTYDRGGRVVLADGEFSYDPFGYLTGSNLAYIGGYVLEEFERDAFGNAVFHHNWTNASPSESPGSATIGQFANTNGRNFSSYGIWRWEGSDQEEEPQDWNAPMTTYGFDGRGNRKSSMAFDYEWELEGPWYDPWHEVRKAATHENHERSYYSASDRLMTVQITRDSIFHDESTGQSIKHASWGAYEEYWYDALGRRVLKRSRQGSPLCTLSTRCYSSIERYVWAGDQILWELRNSDASDQQNPTGGTNTGAIGYIHGGGIDQPLGMTRNGSTIVLDVNWRGLFDGAADTDSLVSFTNVPFPGGSWKASGLFIDPRGNHTWVGSLPMGQADHSGLQYRRNRYYDPASGQFTQQDPIGIAGGLNLYGYANGDPVNFSDPFGLCVPFPACLGAGLAGAALGFTVELAGQALSGDGFDGSDLMTSTVVGGAAGMLSIANTARLGFKIGGQMALSVGEGLLKGQTGDGEMIRNAALGAAGEGLGDLLRKGSEGLRRGATGLIDRLEAGPQTLASGRNSGDVVGEVRRFILRRDLREGALAGAAVGSGSLLDER